MTKIDASIGRANALRTAIAVSCPSSRSSNIPIRPDGCPTRPMAARFATEGCPIRDQLQQDRRVALEAGYIGLLRADRFRRGTQSGQLGSGELALNDPADTFGPDLGL